MTVGLKKVAAICIIRCGTKYLLMKRYNEPNIGMFVPAGGKLEPYETPLAAAIRETYEEVGLLLNDMRFCGILTESLPTKYNWISYIYLADVPYFDAPICNEGEFYWINIQDFSKYPMPPTDYLIYKYVTDNQRFILDAELDEDLNLISMRNELLGNIESRESKVQIESNTESRESKIESANRE